MRRKQKFLNDTQGAALVLVIIVIVMLTLIASFVSNLGFNQRKLVDAASGRRARIYYRAQAGLVDANWRIRVNLGGAYDPADPATSYQLDVDGDGTNDTSVTIGAANAAGVRQINSMGLDV